jgi:hypothetical protein
MSHNVFGQFRIGEGVREKNARGVLVRRAAAEKIPTLNFAKSVKI